VAGDLETGFEEIVGAWWEEADEFRRQVLGGLVGLALRRAISP